MGGVNGELEDWKFGRPKPIILFRRQCLDGEVGGVNGELTWNYNNINRGNNI